MGIEDWANPKSPYNNKRGYNLIKLINAHLKQNKIKFNF
jgi:hypothetical protein